MLDTVVAVSQVEVTDPLTRVLLNQRLVDDVEAREIESVLNNHNASMQKKAVEPLNRILGSLPKPSVEEAPKMELKLLPSHIRYVFLGENYTLPEILSSSVTATR